MPTVIVDTIPIEYCVRESKRAKRISISVKWDGNCEVVVPHGRRVKNGAIEELVDRHKYWMLEHITSLCKNKTKIPLSHQGTPRQLVSSNTKTLVHGRVKTHCLKYPFQVSEIKFRAYKSQWGSCSSRGRLGFHYKLSLLPDQLADYVIIHELCHTIHFNHSKDFWAMVEVFCLEYKKCRKELREYLL